MDQVPLSTPRLPCPNPTHAANVRRIHLILLVVLGVALVFYVQREVRVRMATITIAPQAMTRIEFRWLDGGQWVPVTPDDASAVVDRFNASRRLLARATTPLLPTGDEFRIALAAKALLRYDGIVVEWAPMNGTVEPPEKYVTLSVKK